MKISGIKAFDIKASDIQDIDIKNDFFDYLNELLGLYICLAQSKDDAFQTLYKLQDDIVQYGTIDDATVQEHDRLINEVNSIKKKIKEFSEDWQLNKVNK